MKKIDCRGLACPAPVLQTKEIIEKEGPGTIRVTVDNEAARENVVRFLESQKFSVSVDSDGPVFHVTGNAGEVKDPPSPILANEHDSGKSKIIPAHSDYLPCRTFRKLFNQVSQITYCGRSSSIDS